MDNSPSVLVLVEARFHGVQRHRCAAGRARPHRMRQGFGLDDGAGLGTHRSDCDQGSGRRSTQHAVGSMYSTHTTLLHVRRMANCADYFSCEGFPATSGVRRDLQTSKEGKHRPGPLIYQGIHLPFSVTHFPLFLASSLHLQPITTPSTS